MKVVHSPTYGVFESDAMVYAPFLSCLNEASGGHTIYLLFLFLYEARHKSLLTVCPSVSHSLLIILS